jgi:hypothetical protein
LKCGERVRDGLILDGALLLSKAGQNASNCDSNKQAAWSKSSQIFDSFPHPDPPQSKHVIAVQRRSSAAARCGLPRRRITVRCNCLLADTVMPMIMAVSTLLPVICNLEANTVRALEERRRVIVCVLRISPCFRGGNSERAQLIRHGMDISCGVHAQAKMMKAWRIRLVLRSDPGRSEHKTEVTIEILDMRVAGDAEFVFAEAKRLDQHQIVEPL